MLALPVIMFGLAGCEGTPASNGWSPRSGAHLDQLVKATPTGSPFSQALAADYRAFALEERGENDWYAQDHFAVKGLAAAKNEAVPPEMLSDYAIHGPDEQELIGARASLVAMLATDATVRVPKSAAKAQTQFDCWVHERDEDWQPKEIQECRAGFMTAMAETAPAATAAVAAPPPPKPAPVVKVSGYSVFFDFDKYDLTAEARQNIALAAEKIKATGTGTVHITGYTDTSGSVAYNLKLSVRRADSVEKELAKDGIAMGHMSTEGRGKSDLLVPTPDGVREPKNRRATIELQ
jgi:OOP family OmpA-OmpF porin